MIHFWITASAILAIVAAVLAEAGEMWFSLVTVIASIALMLVGSDE